MSRTWNTCPWQVQKRRLIEQGEGWRFTGYPARCGGCCGKYGRRSEWAHRFEVVLRQRVRLDLHHGREPPQKVIRCVRWWCW